MGDRHAAFEWRAGLDSSTSNRDKDNLNLVKTDLVKKLKINRFSKNSGDCLTNYVQTLNNISMFNSRNSYYPMKIKYTKKSIGFILRFTVVDLENTFSDSFDEFFRSVGVFLKIINENLMILFEENSDALMSVGILPGFKDNLILILEDYTKLSKTYSKIILAKRTGNLNLMEDLAKQFAHEYFAYGRSINDMVPQIESVLKFKLPELRQKLLDKSNQIKEGKPERVTFDRVA